MSWPGRAPSDFSGSQPFARASRPPRARSLETRRLLARGALILPGLGIALLDAETRRDQMAAWTRDTALSYAGALALGALTWGALLAAATVRRGWRVRLVPLACAAFAVGAQRYFFERYHAYLNPRAILVGTSMLPSVGQELWADLGGFLRATLPPLVLVGLLAFACRRMAPVPRTRGRWALDIGLAALLVSMFGVQAKAGGEQAAPPDVLYLAALGRLALTRWQHDETLPGTQPGPRTPAAIPRIVTRGRSRSVLFVVTESVRAADACSSPGADCATTPFTNALLPDRFGFNRMRALDSTTAISLAVLWSGLPPTASRTAMHTAPLLWEYAHAAGFDTAYWTSQNLYFANSGTWLQGIPLSHWVSATDLEPNPTYELGADDAKLADAVIRDLPAMRPPFVGVVHLSNTHFPYGIDERQAPFQPQAAAYGAGDASKVRNRYRDAIYRQDAVVARIVRALRAMPGGDRVAVVFVSDHGEQIRERGAIGHTWGVYDEEVRVPFWIDIGAGELTREQRSTLHDTANAAVTELDVLPTLLDLMGIWDTPELRAFRPAMPGSSLLRGGTPDRDVVLTNCSSIFACAFKNWGALRGHFKLEATQNDTRWNCFDVSRDPEERHDLGASACGDLQSLAEGDGRGTPF